MSKVSEKSATTEVDLQEERNGQVTNVANALSRIKDIRCLPGDGSKQTIFKLCVEKNGGPIRVGSVFWSTKLGGVCLQTRAHIENTLGLEVSNTPEDGKVFVFRQYRKLTGSKNELVEICRKVRKDLIAYVVTKGL